MAVMVVVVMMMMMVVVGGGVGREDRVMRYTEPLVVWSARPSILKVDGQF